MSIEKLLTFDEVLERYKFKYWGLKNLVRKRAVPFVRVGVGRGRIFFDPSDLDIWIEKNKVKQFKKYI